MSKRGTQPNPLPERDAKRLRLWVWIVVVLGVVSVFAALDRFHKQHNPNPTNAHISSTDVRSVMVHDVGFRIPRAFFHPQAVKTDNSMDTTMLLSVELPNIGPQKLPAREYFKMEGPHKLTNILVESPLNPNGTSRMPLKQRLSHFAESYKTTEQGPSHHGLTYLKRAANVRMDRDEIFYEGTKDDPMTVLFCGEIPSYVPYPNCRMQFNYSALIIQISFRRADWLPQWRDIKRNTIARLDEFHTAYLEFQKPNKDNLKKGIDDAESAVRTGTK